MKKTIVMLVLGLVGAVNATTIWNGDFESDSVADGSSSSGPASGFFMSANAGAQVTNPSVGDSLQAAGGNNYAHVGLTGGSEMIQNTLGTLGEEGLGQYRFDADVAFVGSYNWWIIKVTTTASDSHVLADYNMTHYPTQVGQWSHVSFVFDTNYAGEQARLWLTGQDVAFDNVTITAVPEPATMLLLSFGGLLLRRKRNA
jgi:hypothetical protein